MEKIEKTRQEERQQRDMKKKKQPQQDISYSKNLFQKLHAH
jgi:hypothetical protein